MCLLEQELVHIMLFIKLGVGGGGWGWGGGGQEHGGKNIQMSHLMSDAYFSFLPLCLSLLGRGARK